MITSLSPQQLTAVRHLGATSAAAEVDGDYDVVIDAVWPGRCWAVLHRCRAGPEREAAARLVRQFGPGLRVASALMVGWDLCWTPSYPLAAGARVFTGV